MLPLQFIFLTLRLWTRFGRRYRSIPKEGHQIHGQKEDRWPKQDEGFHQGHQLQPRYANPILCRHPSQQRSRQQRQPQGRHQKTIRQGPRQSRLRGTIQDRQEQVVLPETPILNYPIQHHMVLSSSSKKNISINF